MLFLQAAGSDFSTAHDLVAAVTEIVRAPHGEFQTGLASRSAIDPERIAARMERAGFKGVESLLVALAVHGTFASSSNQANAGWIASVAARVDDEELLREAAGVVFAFNTINRIADARRVKLEYRFLRELKPIRGWVERRLSSLTALAYDLTFKHRSRESSPKLLDRLSTLLDRLGISEVPGLFNWLSRSPVVLEGVLEMLQSNVASARVRSDLLQQAMAIGIVSRAALDSDLSRAVETWLPSEALGDAEGLRGWAAPTGTYDSDLTSACRRYAWQVANAAYTITDEQIDVLRALGLSDAELLDLTLATAVFSALAIIEPISEAAERAAATKELGHGQSKIERLSGWKGEAPAEPLSLCGSIAYAARQEPRPPEYEPQNRAVTNR